MKTACFIPIKAHSTRVPGKNTLFLNGKKLYSYICQNVKSANVFDDIYIDTDCDEVMTYAENNGFSIIRRKPELALDSANGNDLLVHHYLLFPNYDFYFQAFATAPYLHSDSIKECFSVLTTSVNYDSCFTAVENHSLYWFRGIPVNYRPGILPRTQDMEPVLEETTGFYGISRESLDKYRCRIGRKPYIHVVDKFQAVDIDSIIDFKIAEQIGKIVYSK